MTWTQVPLSELALPSKGSFVDGPFGSNLKAAEYETGGVPIIRLQNIRANEFLDKDIKFISQQKAVELGRHNYSPGDLVISKLGDPPGYACVVPPSAGSGIIVADVVRFRGDPKLVDHQYLSYFLNSPRGRREFLQLSKGSTRTRVNLSSIKTIKIPLPPTLDEQKRIAALLDKVSELRRQRQQTIQISEKLIQSIFIDMFVKNPEMGTWSLHKIDWMTKNEKGAIRTGPFGSQLLHSEFVAQGVAVLGIDNAVNNRFEWSRLRFITPDKYQTLKRYKVFPGDLIVTIMGTLGRCAIVPDDIPEAINTKHLCCITLDHKKCIPEFLHACFLYHPSVLRQLGVRTKGAVMPGLNMGIIKDLELPLPPIHLQERFTRIAATGSRARIASEESQYNLDRLFGALSQRAFEGGLNLDRLEFELDFEALTVRNESEIITVDGLTYTRPGTFIAPPEIEIEMFALEEKFGLAVAEPRPWSENYFKYRTLSQALKPPFSFAEIWKAAQNDMEEARYEDVKSKIFEYLEQGILEQRFDEARKEIVFYVRP